MKETVIFDTYDLINRFSNYTSEDLRKMADLMDSKGILSFEVCAEDNYGSPNLVCEAKRLATPEEIKKKKLENEQYKESQRLRDLENLKQLKAKYEV